MSIFVLLTVLFVFGCLLIVAAQNVSPLVILLFFATLTGGALGIPTDYCADMQVSRKRFAAMLGLNFYMMNATYFLLMNGRMS